MKKLLLMSLLTLYVVSLTASERERLREVQGKLLCAMVAQDKIDFIAQLIQDGAPLDVTCSIVGGLLHTAAYHGSVNAAKELIKLKADVNAKNTLEFTPLANAFLGRKSNYAQVVQVLLDAKADPNTLDGFGGAPLHMAAANCDTAVTEMLMKAGANYLVRSPIGETPLELAARFCKKDVVDTMRKMSLKNVRDTILQPKK